MKGDQKMLIKDNIQINKHSDCFLKPQKEFEDLSNIAYGDMARHTLHIDDTDEEKQVKRNTVTELLKKAISDYSGESYDVWHKGVCEKIKECYGVYGDAFRHGQAQKWLNMLIKYIYVYDVQPYTSFFDRISDFSVLHAPLDNKVIELAKAKLSIPYPTNAWSKMGYEEYQKYQDQLKATLATSPFKNHDEQFRFYRELINWS